MYGLNSIVPIIIFMSDVQFDTFFVYDTLVHLNHTTMQRHKLIDIHTVNQLSPL